MQHARHRPLTSPALPPEDDFALRPLPSRHVDYLSYNWQEEELWCSWRLVISRPHLYSEPSRLENASWRSWAKQKNSLRTVPPESLNWLKESDVTWLYGPLHPLYTNSTTSTSSRSAFPTTSSTLPNQSSIPFSVPHSPLISSPSHTHAHPPPPLSSSSYKKPILKRPLSFSHSIVPKSFTSTLAYGLNFRYSPFEDPRNFNSSISPLSIHSHPHPPPSPPSPLPLSPFPRSPPPHALSIPALQTNSPPPPEKKRIRFDDHVKQFIAVDLNNDDDEDDTDDCSPQMPFCRRATSPSPYDQSRYSLYDDDTDDDDDDDGIIMMKPSTLSPRRLHTIYSTKQSVSGKLNAGDINHMQQDQSSHYQNRQTHHSHHVSYSSLSSLIPTTNSSSRSCTRSVSEPKNIIAMLPATKLKYRQDSPLHLPSQNIIPTSTSPIPPPPTSPPSRPLHLSLSSLALTSSPIAPSQTTHTTIPRSPTHINLSSADISMTRPSLRRTVSFAHFSSIPTNLPFSNVSPISQLNCHSTPAHSNFVTSPASSSNLSSISPSSLQLNATSPSVPPSGTTSSPTSSFASSAAITAASNTNLGKGTVKCPSPNSVSHLPSATYPAQTTITPTSAPSSSTSSSSIASDTIPSDSQNPINVARDMVHVIWNLGWR